VAVSLRSDWSQDSCPVARGADVFGDPWCLLIVREIFVGNRRFEGLRSTLAIAENVLSVRLRRLVDAGLLRRTPYGVGPRPRQEYQLTPAGEDALPILNALSVWADKHTTSPSGRSMQIVCTECGQSSSSADWCTTCRAPLTAASTAWDRPSSPGHRTNLSAHLVDAVETRPLV